MKLPQDSHEKMMSAYQLIAGGSISLSSFEHVRTILKGVHPQLDEKLDICSKALDKLQKIESGDIISLSADALPEKDEKQKKRKKAVLFFIGSLKDLQSEIKRVDAELTHANSFQGQLMSAGRIIKFAKGPFGFITGAAVIIVGIMLLTSHKSTPIPVKSTNLQAQTGKTVQVITFNGKQLPLSGLYIGYGPDCDSPHYHAINGRVTALDGTIITDPEGCGFGKVKDTQVISVVR